MHTSNIDPKQIGYSWVPPGIVTSSKIQKYFDLLPKEKVPKIGSIGERYRIKQLNYQLPKQDIDYSFCKHVGLDRECFEEFVTARNEIALDVGYIKECGANSMCVNCKEQINQGELAVNATKFSNRVIWHPRCFQCCICEELLVDLTYCTFEEKLFCERHYAEIFKPRCNSCDEGTADKPSRKTPCENDELDACVLLEHIDKAYSLTQYDENASLEAFEEHDPEQTNTNLTMKKCDKQSNLMEYFNNSSDVKPQDDGSNDQAVQITIDTPNDIVDPNINGTKSRDDRSSTVYSRTDSETSNLFYKSKSRDSSSSGYVEQAYNRSDSSNSCIQDELDSEEYHHYHRFSMTADALEYIRGRDDWKVHTENKLNDLYRRQSSIISIQEEIDSDEYHHNRVLSDIIQMAYLEPDSNQSLPSLPSSFEEDKVFDRYYLELEQIKDHLSNDIEQNIAQKQLILLDSSDVQHTEGYVYPLPDIVLDQIVDRNDTPYMFDIQLGSDYENVMSESEDDVQSVIEVNRDDKYEREIIATLDVDSKIDEMIEVTVWDLKTDLSKEMSSKEYAVGIIRSTNENLIQDVDFEQTIEGGTETSNNEEVTAPTDDRKAIIDEVDKLNDEVNMVEVLDNVKDTPGLKSTETEHVLQIETTETLPDVIDGSLENDSSTSNLNRSFIEHERSSSVLQSANPSLPVMPAVKKVSKIIKKVTSYENVDDLIKEGCMGVWFHN